MSSSSGVGLVLKKVVITFTAEGQEIAVTYTHDGVESASPGSKGRVLSASRMARAALEAALAYLDKGEAEGTCRWGGFSTGTQEATDSILVDRPKGIDRKKRKGAA